MATIDAIALDRVPERARNAIIQCTRGIPIKDIHSAISSGKVVYDIALDKGEGNGFRIDQDGGRISALEIEGGSDLGDVKVSMQVFMRFADAGLIRQIEGRGVGEHAGFAALIESDGRLWRMVVDAHGNLMARFQMMREVDLKTLPQALRSMIVAHAQDRQIIRIEELRDSSSLCYEVKLADEVQITDLRIDETGGIVER